jgi:hypothetical protein
MGQVRRLRFGGLGMVRLGVVARGGVGRLWSDMVWPGMVARGGSGQLRQGRAR